MRGLFSLSRMFVAVAGVGTSLGVSLLVSSFSAPGTVALPQWSGPNYRQDVRGFHPVTHQLLSDLKRTPSPLPSPRTPAGTPGGPGAQPSSGGSTPQSGPSSPASPGTGPTPAPSPSPAPAPRLAVVITADKTTAKQRDTITYTIRVANGGSATANRVVVESHVPDGTSLRSWTCDGQTIQANGASSFTCGDPGSPAPDHPVVWAFASLAPGASLAVQFTVRIDPAVPHNANIVDHAHAYASNADLTDSDPVSVIVR